MPLDNFPFGPKNAAENVPYLLDKIPLDQSPADPYVPPNPVRDLYPSASIVLDALGFEQVGLGDTAVQHDLLI